LAHDDLYPAPMRALRLLYQSKSYAWVSIITLATALALNVAMFSVVDALLLRHWPFPRADRVVNIQGNIGHQQVLSFSPPEIADVRKHTTGFSAIAAITGRPAILGNEFGLSERVNTMCASPEIFDVLRVQPVLGRGYRHEDGERVALLSFRFWESKYGKNPQVLGRSVVLDGTAFTILGVMPDSCERLPLWGGIASYASVWTPLRYKGDEQFNRSARFYDIIARLSDDSSKPQRRTDFLRLAKEQTELFPTQYPTIEYRTVPLNRSLMDSAGTKVTWSLLGLSGFVLLIACANLANLKLAALTVESHSHAVRCALGASVRDLIIDQLKETCILCSVAGLLGGGLAALLNHLIERQFAQLDQPISITWNVVFANIGVIAGTAIALAILPAWFVSRVNISAALKDQARGSSSAPGQNRTQRGLIVVQVALAMVLLSGAGIMNQSLRKFLNRETGWDVNKLTVGVLPIPEERYNSPEKLNRYLENVESKLRQSPGVENAAIATSLPLQNYNSSRPVYSEAQLDLPAAQRANAFHIMVSQGYFETMGIRLVEGEYFKPGIKATDPEVVIVNESLAKQLWPGRSAIGQRLASQEGSHQSWRQVIGVVRDVSSATDFGNPETQYQVYRPLAKEPWPWVQLVVRSRAPAAAVAIMRHAVSEVDPDVAPEGVMTAVEFIQQAHRNINLISKILACFSIVGVGMGALGLYGLISRVVVSKQVEFGIRMAIGAQPIDIFGLVLRMGMKLALVGCALGLGGAYALGLFLQNALPRLVSPEPGPLISTLFILLAVAGIACWIPSRRATRVTPLIAMRAQ